VNENVRQQEIRDNYLRLFARDLLYEMLLLGLKLWRYMHLSSSRANYMRLSGIALLTLIHHLIGSVKF
jgi:hypothetical protein